MIISTTTNQSPTRIFSVVEPCDAFTAVELTADGVKPAGASSIPIGIVTETDDTSATVQMTGGGLWQVGSASILAGDFLSSDNGLAVKATSGQFALAVALADASANSTAEVQIVHAGKA